MMKFYIAYTIKKRDKHGQGVRKTEPCMMTKHLPIASIALAIAILVPSTASAQTAPGRISGSIVGGADIPVDGDVHGGTTAQVPDLGPLNPALSGVSAELRIGARSFEDIYGTTWNIGVEAAYGLSEKDELFGSFRYQHGNEGRVQVGGAFVPALATELPVFGTFSDLNVYALELGYRRYFGGGPLKPYVAGRGGVAFTDSIQATFEIPDAAITIADAPFYGRSTSYSVGGDIGVSYRIGETVSLIAEAGLRYTSRLEGDDSAIGGLGLASINEVGGRLDVPLRAGLRVQF